MSRFSRLSVGAAVAILAAVLAGHCPVLGDGEAAAVVALLPAGEEMENWVVVEDSQTYCADPDSLTDMYDGGYEKYVDAGVQQAAVQAYESNDELILVYLHEMTSAKEAEAIYKDSYGSLEEGSGTLNELELKDGGFVYVGEEQSSAYLWRDRFYCNVVGLGEEEGTQKAVQEFLELVGKKIGCYLGEDEEGGECQGSVTDTEGSGEATAAECN